MNDIVVSRIEKSYISMVLGHEGPGNLLSWKWIHFHADKGSS